MLTDFLWKAFEQTGSIESYMTFKELVNGEHFSKEEDNTVREVALSNTKEV